MVHLYDIEVNLIAGLTTESSRIFGETVMNTRRPHDEVLYVSGSRSFFYSQEVLAWSVSMPFVSSIKGSSWEKCYLNQDLWRCFCL